GRESRAEVTTGRGVDAAHNDDGDGVAGALVLVVPDAVVAVTRRPHRAPHEPVDPVRVDVGVAAAGEVDRRQGQAGGLVALPVAGDDVPGDLESVAAGTVDRVAHSPIETAVKDLDGHVVGLGGGDVHAVPF